MVRGYTAVEKRYYKIQDCAKIIGVNRHTLNVWKKSGKLVPLCDETGKNYYSEEQIRQFTERCFGKKINNGNNWIDLTSIECEVTRHRYKWKKACDNKQIVSFYYNGKQGSLQFLSCKGITLTIEIDGQQKTISTGMLLSVNLGRITGSISFDHKYVVGERIRIGKTDITILECCRIGSKKIRAYLYRCNKCGQENTISEYNINDKGSCPICNGSKVVQGINDIATTDTWMIPYFDDEKLTLLYSHGSKETPAFHCPDCGRKRKKPLQICTLYRTKSIGCICGDGYSYPNKLMFSVLEQLLNNQKIAAYENEYNADWTEGRKFDFLVTLLPDENKIIIEMDGLLGHGYNSIDKNIPPEKAKKIDLWKDAQAKRQDIPVVRVDARKSTIEYLKESIIKSISSIIDLSGVDWIAAEKFAISNLTKRVCQYYENNKPITTEQLGKVFHISQTTALSYIQRGEQYGWCTYDWEYYYDRKYSFSRKEHNRREERVITVCNYYKSHKPILVVEMAKHFGMYPSTIIDYLKEGEKMGYEPYDKEYALGKSIEKLKTSNKKHLGRAVLCFTKNQLFYRRYSSLTEAAKEIGVTLSAISRCCRKKGTSAGFIFRYEDDCELPVE